MAACKLAGVKPRFVTYAGDSPVAFIIAANLQRRHLDKGQKIALAIDLEPLFAAEARKRQLAALETSPKRGGKVVENVPQPIPRSRDQAAAAVGLSGKLVSAAKAIKVASPERFEKVKTGTLSIAKAKKEIKAEAARQVLGSDHQIGITLRGMSDVEMSPSWDWRIPRTG